MARILFIWSLLAIKHILVLIEAAEDFAVDYMSKDEREFLKEETRDMFYHAYNAYMDNAYPADELMPLSCKGRYRGTEDNRGDIDYTLGNFSLTLVDTLDTLVVLGDFEEFENSVKLVITDITFDIDVIVSLFETNIRMLGGLLSSHILAEYLQQRADIMTWYRGELLDLAKDLGYRFLPAFNTTTGIPYGRINLKYGMRGVPVELSKETCTACAGSMILEMAALSRLTGEPIFEEKAQKAMDVLWKMRHRGTDLMGSVLNVHSGDWVRRDSGVGAGIDSYYEYCLKAYILLGDEKYLGRFNRHYQAIMKYVSQGPMLLDVHMHRPNTNSKNFMDALLAFWPGLQVLKGDIKPAVETHEMLYQVMQRHNFIPEAFTTDFQVHWGHHPLRPEFLESTYFLYRATGDHYYLNVGRKVLRSLQTYARVPCGYAAVSDVRTNKHDDTMDSFFLSETLKYLFLLFAEPSDLMLNLDEFIFTTEGHLLPLTLSFAKINISTGYERDLIHVEEMDRTCPNSLHLFPATVRQPLRNMVEDVCPKGNLKRRLSAFQFQASNTEHLKILSEMGITILTLADGRIQLLHKFSNAKSPQHAEEGVAFMQEMDEVSKMQTKQSQTSPQIVSFEILNTSKRKVTLLAGPAHFGPVLRGSKKVTGKVAVANPFMACTDLVNADFLKGKIAVVFRGDCVFVEKARRIQNAGAIAGIVLDNMPGSSAATSPMFAMSGDAKDEDDVKIPIVFLFTLEARELLTAFGIQNHNLVVTIRDFQPTKDTKTQLNAPTDVSMFERLKGSFKEFLSRQIMSQYSPSNDEVLDREVETEGKITIFFGNLEAVIMNGPDEKEIQICATLPMPISAKLTQKSKRINHRFDLDSLWQLLKQAFVSEIYAKVKDKTGMHIKASVLRSLFDTIMQERKIKLESSLTDCVFWFLSELNDVTPDPALLHINQFVQLKLIKENLIAHLLNPAISKTNNNEANIFQNIDYSILSQKLLFDYSIYSDYCMYNMFQKIIHAFTFQSTHPTELKSSNNVPKNERDTEENNFETFLLTEVEKAVKDIIATEGEKGAMDKIVEADMDASLSSSLPPLSLPSVSTSFSPSPSSDSSLLTSSIEDKQKIGTQLGPHTFAQFIADETNKNIDRLYENSSEVLKRIRKKIMIEVRMAMNDKIHQQKLQNYAHLNKLYEPEDKLLKDMELPNVADKKKLKQKEDSTFKEDLAKKKDKYLTKSENYSTDSRHIGDEL